MNNKTYLIVLYIIIIVIIGTITLQGYWNYKNYLSNKQQLINEVQLCLDNAVEKYFSQITLDNCFIEIDDHCDFRPVEDTICSHKKDLKTHIYGINTVQSNIIINDLTKIATNLFFSENPHTLNLESIDSLLNKNLSHKKLQIYYELKQTSKAKYSNILQENNAKVLTTSSSSSLIAQDKVLFINYTNVTKIVLKRIFIGILISALLILCVIACLAYLLHIIKYQKQIAEAKNDLINNITHEFKTPIATIGVALESIKDFNITQDTAKTNRYLEMSMNQLSNLNTMVEKILETASLDSKNLSLSRENTNISTLVNKLVEKHKMQSDSKSISWSQPQQSITATVDPFHFENAINNVIDNAVKYGGKPIEVVLNTQDTTFNIVVADSGTSLKYISKEKLFDKFYRVPTGNTHNVKGFGIGLYYTKKIIEKHGGTISLDISPTKTTFIITLPYDT